MTSKTEKIAEKIYKWDFGDHTGNAPLFRDAIKAVEDVVEKMGLKSPGYDNIGWIKQSIQKYDASYKIENSLNKIQVFLKTVLTSLDDTF